MKNANSVYIKNIDSKQALYVLGKSFVGYRATSRINLNQTISSDVLGVIVCLSWQILFFSHK